jgi:6-phosphogluconolactonase
MAKLDVAEVIVRPAADLPAAGAAWIGARLAGAIAARGAATLGLSGGSTPGPTYRELARVQLDWARVHVYFVDERCVPPDSPQSNYRLARETLLDAVGAAVTRIEGEREDREAAAADYEARLPDAIDVLVMGVGDDGHTASLFPGGPWDRPAGRKVLATRAPAPPHERLGLSPDAIRAAGARLVIVTGAKKAGLMALALEGEPDPARYPMFILGGSAWLLDEAAAARLKERSHE